MSKDQKPTDNPALSISVDEIDNKIGRLYRKPDFILPEKLNLVTIKELVKAGDLVPSTTNVLGVRSSPYLLPWAAKVVARDMAEMAITNSDFLERIKRNKYGAIDYFKKAPERERDFAGTQGSNIHLAVELLGLGESITHLELTEYERLSVDQWKRWSDAWQPNFKHLEITGFGKTEDNLGYGKTTDFIADINGKTTIGDYKCVVDDTPILLPTGAVIPASELKENDQVVSWTKEKGLHVGNVSFVGDNGYHKTVTLTTSSGQTITTTLNHPFWSSRKNKNLGWVQGEDLNLGDEVYIGLGWNYSPERQEIVWPYAKNLSPYLFGLLWTLRNYSRQDLRTEHLIDLPPIARAGLQDELKEIGFIFNKAGKLNTRKGFAKIARKNGMEVEDLLDLIDTPDLPDFVYGGSKAHIAAFIAGTKEVFANREIYSEEVIIVLNTKLALQNLQQFFLNYGQPASIHRDQKNGLQYMKVPFESTDTIYAYGPTASRITSIEMNDEVNHTIAIEVEGSHTHITSGIITHNTNRSGLHADVAIQLAANARVSHIAVDNNTKLIKSPKIELALAVHISPKGVKVMEVDNSDKIFDTFQSLRRVWDFQAFDGKLNEKNGVFLREVKRPEDL
jgi:hypothetical protein